MCWLYIFFILLFFLSFFFCIQFDNLRNLVKMLWNHHMNLHDKYYCPFSNPSAGSFYAIWSQKYNTWWVAIATDEVVAWRSKPASLPKALRNWVWWRFRRVSWFLFEFDERTYTNFSLGQMIGVYIFVFFMLYLSSVLKKEQLLLEVVVGLVDFNDCQNACGYICFCLIFLPHEWCSFQWMSLMTRG